MNNFDIQKALDLSKIQEDLDKIDRKSKGFDNLVKIIESGSGSPRDFVDILKSSNFSLKDYIYFLECSLKYRNVNFYDAILDLALDAYPNNIHLLFYKVIFGSYSNSLSDKDLELFIDSGFYKYTEFAFSKKIKSAEISSNFSEIKKILQRMQESELPYGYKQPILDLFSRVTSTGGMVRPNNYEELILGLLDVFRKYIVLDKHPWYLRMYLRLHMYIVRSYDRDIYHKTYNQVHANSLDEPTALYNLLHLYNYSKINQIDISFDFLDADMRLLLDRHPSTMTINSLLKQNYRPVSKRKIALIISGQVRGLKAGQIKILNSVGFDVDVFISTWNKKGFKIPYNLNPEPYYRIFSKNLADILYKKGLLGEVLYRRYPSIIEVLQENVAMDPNILRTHQWCSFAHTSSECTLRSVEVIDEDCEELNHDFSKFNIKKYNNSMLDNQSKMFYMNYRGYLLMNNHEEQINESYEYVLKVRPDIEVEIDVHELTAEINSVQAVSADVMRSYDCGDRVAFGSSLIMRQYMCMFKVLHIYQYQPGTMFGCGIFKVHAPLDYQVVSSGGQIYRSSHVRVGNHLDLNVFSDEYILKIMYDDAKNRGFDEIDHDLFDSFDFGWLS